MIAYTEFVSRQCYMEFIKEMLCAQIIDFNYMVVCFSLMRKTIIIF